MVLDSLMERAPAGVVGTLLRTVGRSSASVRLGFRRGFDSGEMMEQIYRNSPRGHGGIGWLADWLYLQQVGCRALRGRKALIKATLHATVQAQRAAHMAPHILDVAAGSALYLVELLAEQGNAAPPATARDIDRQALHRGAALARRAGIERLTFREASALDPTTFHDLAPRPTIAIVSGFYELLLDDASIRRSMALLHGALVPGGTLLFTTQVNHPQLELIARTLPDHTGAPWRMKNRPLMQVEAWALAAGFHHVASALEPNGVFALTSARA